MSANVKTCIKCKVEKPHTFEYYSQNKRTGYWHSWCRECCKENRKKWTKNNPVKNKVFSNKWGSGVYGIFENGVCLYVGESKALSHRIASHKSRIKKPHKAPKSHYELSKNLSYHTGYVIGILEQTNNHKEREQYYINKLKPKYNE